jgi:hypothetical protein
MRPERPVAGISIGVVPAGGASSKPAVASADEPGDHDRRIRVHCSDLLNHRLCRAKHGARSDGRPRRYLVLRHAACPEMESRHLRRWSAAEQGERAAHWVVAHASARLGFRWLRSRVVGWRGWFARDSVAEVVSGWALASRARSVPGAGAPSTPRMGTARDEWCGSSAGAGRRLRSSLTCG